MRLVVPFAAGSTTDMYARIFANSISAEWRRPVVVENRAGANGFLAAEAVLRARPDGHTVMFASNTLFATNPALFRRLPYDPVADFAPVTLVGVSPLVVPVNNDLPVRTRQDPSLTRRRARAGSTSPAATAPPAAPGSCSRRWQGSTPCISATLRRRRP